jgi:parallel beta-helix repeat protein
MSSHVAVDCAEHTLGGVSLATGVSDVSIQHCRTSGLANLNGVSNVTIADSTLPNYIFLVNARNVLIRRNSISTGGVSITGGSNNQILDNEIDGGYHGHDLTGQGSDARGVDDGIVLSNTSDDIVQGNTIANVFDAGIEGVDQVQRTTIAQNRISNAIKAGISSYWCTVWDGDVIRGNTVAQSLTLLWVVGGDGPGCTAPSPVTFFINGTTITNNQLVDPLTGDKGPFASMGILIELAGMGNMLQGNDVGSEGIMVGPVEAFADGGGNVCGPQGNFHC